MHKYTPRFPGEMSLILILILLTLTASTKYYMDGATRVRHTAPDCGCMDQAGSCSGWGSVPESSPLVSPRPVINKIL